MSKTFYLASDETKTCYWAGQSHLGKLSNFGVWSGSPVKGTKQDALSAYLAAHINRPIKLVPDEHLDHEKYAEVDAIAEDGEVCFRVHPEALERDQDDSMAKKLGPDFRIYLPTT